MISCVDGGFLSSDILKDEFEKLESFCQNEDIENITNSLEFLFNKFSDIIHHKIIYLFRQGLSNIPLNLFALMIRPYLRSAPVVECICDTELYLQLILNNPFYFLDEEIPNIVWDPHYVEMLQIACMIRGDYPKLMYIVNSTKHIYSSEFRDKLIDVFVFGSYSIKDLSPEIREYLASKFPLLPILKNDYWSFNYLTKNNHLIKTPNVTYSQELILKQKSRKLVSNILKCPNLDFLAAFPVLQANIYDVDFHVNLIVKEEYQQLITVSRIVINNISNELTRMAMTVIHDYFSLSLKRLT